MAKLERDILKLWKEQGRVRTRALDTTSEISRSLKRRKGLKEKRGRSRKPTPRTMVKCIFANCSRVDVNSWLDSSLASRARNGPFHELLIHDGSKVDLMSMAMNLWGTELRSCGAF